MNVSERVPEQKILIAVDFGMSLIRTWLFPRNKLIHLQGQLSQAWCGCRLEKYVETRIVLCLSN